MYKYGHGKMICLSLVEQMVDEEKKRHCTWLQVLQSLILPWKENKKLIFIIYKVNKKSFTVQHIGILLGHPTKY